MFLGVSQNDLTCQGWPHSQSHQSETINVLQVWKKPMQAHVFNLTYPKYGNYLYMVHTNKWWTQIHGARYVQPWLRMRWLCLEIRQPQAKYNTAHEDLVLRLIAHAITCIQPNLSQIWKLTVYHIWLKWNMVKFGGFQCFLTGNLEDGVILDMLDHLGRPQGSYPESFVKIWIHFAQKT